MPFWVWHLNLQSNEQRPKKMQQQIIFLSLFLFLLFICCSYGQDYTLITAPSNDDGNLSYIPIYTTGESVSLSCNLSNATTGQPVPVRWSITNASIDSSVEFDMNTNISLQYDNLLTNDIELQHTITLSEFTAEWNRVSFTCRPIGGQMDEPLHTFTIGIPSKIYYI